MNAHRYKYRSTVSLTLSLSLDTSCLGIIFSLSFSHSHNPYIRLYPFLFLGSTVSYNHFKYSAPFIWLYVLGSFCLLSHLVPLSNIYFDHSFTTPKTKSEYSIKCYYYYEISTFVNQYKLRLR